MTVRRRLILQGFFLLLIVAGAAVIAFPRILPSLGRFETHLGLDIRGGAQLVYRADIARGVPNGNKQEIEDALSGVRDVIARRVDPNGVGEALVQVQGEDQLLVELPGITDVQQAITLIGQTPLLEFRQEGKDPNTFVPTKLTGAHLVRANITQQQGAVTPVVSLTFNAEGRQLFATLTTQSVGKRIAIYLDGAIISAPVVQQAITNGEAVITGNFTLTEARELKQRLNAGALPVPIALVSQHIVGATLGAQSVAASLFAGIVGFIAVALFMIVLYRWPGFLAVVSLLYYAFISLALFKVLQITLSVAGIAGFILSIGMAVDANVLIFERLREEIRRGRTLNDAITEGFRRAWPSIRDSNVSTLLTTALLFIFTTIVIKGFAITLGIGVAVSMFSAITMTRFLLRATAGRWLTQHPFVLGARPLPPPSTST